MAWAAAFHMGKGFKLKSCLCFLDFFWLVPPPRTAFWSSGPFAVIRYRWSSSRWSRAGGAGGLQAQSGAWWGSPAVALPHRGDCAPHDEPLSRRGQPLGCWEPELLLGRAPQPATLISSRVPLCHCPQTRRRGRRAPADAQYSGHPSQKDPTLLCSKPKTIPTWQLLAHRPPPMH